MMGRIFYVILLCGFYFPFTGNAQESVDESPKDLDSSTTIFIEYEMYDLDWKPKGMFDKMRYKKMRKYNDEVPKANDLLIEELSEYPFNYKIIKLEDLSQYKEMDNVYVLEYIYSPNLEREGHGMIIPEIRPGYDPQISGPVGNVYLIRFRKLSTGDLFYFPFNIGFKEEIPLPYYLPAIIKYLKKEYKIKK